MTNLNINDPGPDAGVPADAGARERAVTATGVNLVVIAGAGSGKTSLLVERIVYLLMTAEIAPASWTALTFTEAAAAQMRARVAGALHWLAAPAADLACARPGAKEGKRALGRLLQLGWTAARAAELAEELLSQFEPACISTIHGFCLQLLGRHPAEAGISPDFKSDDGSELKRFADESWPDVAAGASSPERARELGELLQIFDWTDFRILYEQMLDASCPVERWIAEGIPPGIGAEAALARLRGAPERLLRLRAAFPKPTGFPRMLEHCARAAEVALEKGPGAVRAQFRSRIKKEKTTSTKVDGVEVEWALEIYKLLDVCWRVDEENVHRAIRFLSIPAAEARARRAREGWLSFDGMLAAARDLLRDHPEIRRAEGVRLQHILVDEFQDNDPLQYELIFHLAEERTGGRAKLAPGKIFIVGDPKQAIYRFRGADMEAYARAVDSILADGGARLELNVSFRSPSAILDPVDRLFSDWLPPLDAREIEHRAAPEYIKIAPHRAAPDPGFAPPSGGPRVEIWSPAEAPSEARRAQEARWIADDIILNITKTNGRVRAGDHAILLRYFSNVAIYSRALEERGIQVVLQGGRTFYARGEVSDLRAWIRAVAEQNDTISLLAALRSAAGAVPDRELQAFAAGGIRWNAQIDAAESKYPNIARAFRIIRALREYSAAHTADETVREILIRTRLYELHSAGFDGAQRAANLEKCEELAAELARTRGLALDEIAGELARRAKTEGSEGERALAEAGGDAAQILTIHGAKGLEFKIVYIADLAGGRRVETSETRVRAEPDGACSANLAQSLRMTWPAAARAVRDEIHRNAEDRRLFYVASTRAEERLILIGGRKGKGPASPWLDRIRAAFLYQADLADRAALMDGAVIHRAPPERYTNDTLAADGAPEFTKTAAAFAAAADRARAGARAPLLSPTGLAESREAERDEEGGSRARRDDDSNSGNAAAARAAGVAAHAVFEIVDFKNPSSPLLPPDELLRIAADAAAGEGADAAAVLRDVTEILATFEKSELRARLRNVKILARELPLLARGDGAAPHGNAVHGYADLLFEEGGAIVLADWKTDCCPTPRALDEAVVRHAPQLQFYKQTLEAILNRTVRAELFFVRHNSVRVLI